MIEINMQGKSVLITGGTRGIGLATAVYFAKAGAQTYLTYKWGAENYDYLYQAIDEVKGLKPVLIEADVSVNEDTDKLLEQIQQNEKKINYYISNVGVSQRTMNLDEYKKKSLFTTIEYSTWPLIEYTRKIKQVFGSYPEHIVGISSDGPSHFYQGYDFVAASKALLEHFAKYLSIHLFKEGTQVNVIRFGSVETESFEMIFGKAFFDYLKDNNIPEDFILKPDECGKAVFGLCSGFMAAMNGQIITVDKGMPFQDNIMMRYLTSNK